MQLRKLYCIFTCSVLNKIFSITKVRKKFLIPFPASNGAKTVIRVIDPAGTNHDYTVGSGDPEVNDYNFFADKGSTAELPEAQQVPQLGMGRYRYWRCRLHYLDDYLQIPLI